MNSELSDYITYVENYINSLYISYTKLEKQFNNIQQEIKSFIDSNTFVEQSTQQSTQQLISPI